MAFICSCQNYQGVVIHKWNITIVHILCCKLEADIQSDKHVFERMLAWRCTFNKMYVEHSEMAANKNDHLEPLSLGTAEAPDLPRMSLISHGCLVWKISHLPAKIFVKDHIADNRRRPEFTLWTSLLKAQYWSMHKEKNQADIDLDLNLVLWWSEG